MHRRITISLLALIPTLSHAEGLRVEAPIQHQNLSIFLVRGGDTLAGEAPLTLGEALKQKKVRVHETSNVNELQLENLSGQPVLALAGDIVKGGRQDRTLGTDLILPPRSGKVPIAAFCVESGRWQRRGAESAAQFSGSEKALSSKGLKLAARKAKNQSEVWSEVSKVQDKLERNVARPVKSRDSETSLQLTLEHANVAKSMSGYLEALKRAPDKYADVVGFAFAVDGHLSSTEVFGSPAIFKAVWPKLLEAAVVEALAEKGEAKPGAAPANVQAVTARVNKAPSKAKAKVEQLPNRTEQRTYEDAEETVFETRDAAGRLVHQSRY